MQKLIEAIRKEADSLWPVPIPSQRIDKFLTRNKLKPEQELSLLWLEYKHKHITGVRNRYGLDDVRPFGYTSGELLFEVKWQYSEEGCYKLAYSFPYENPVTITGKNSNAHDIIIKNIQTFAKKYGENIALQALPDKGKFKLYQNFKPEHDWQLWASNMRAKYPKLSKVFISRQISEYKTGKSTANSLYELEALLANRAKTT